MKKRSARTRRKPAPASDSNSNSSAGHTVGIIGVEGRYGRWLERRFKEFGHTVIGSDIGGEFSNTDVVNRADIVVFSVPIAITESVIAEVVPHSKEGQLWIDVTSVKEAPVTAMLKSKADVIGLHPMCGPDLHSWNGQTVAVTFSRDANPRWKKFVQDFLEWNGAAYYVVSPEEHDENMAYVQALPHALSMVLAGTFTSLGKSGVNVSETWRYATPPYKLAFACVSRILATKNWDLYADIQISNRKNTLAVLQEIQNQARYLHNCIENENKDGIKDLLAKAVEQFTKANVEAGNNQFLRLSNVMADLNTENRKVFHCRNDEAGLLEQILKHFTEHGVNLSSLHSSRSDEYKGYSFQLGFERDRDSLAVREAICAIRNDKKLRDVVIVEDF